MAFNKGIFFRYALALFVIVGLGFGGRQYWLVRQERNGLNAELTRSESINDQLQKKYREKKASEAYLIRQKLMLSGQLRNRESEIDVLSKKLEAIKTTTAKETDSLKNRLNRQIQSLQKEKERIEAVNAKLTQRIASAEDTIRDQGDEINTLQEAKQTVERSLARYTANLKRCTEHNQEFAYITKDLLRKYEGKNLLKSIQEVEPFTQMKRIEIEKMIQQYTDKIEDSIFEARP
jgi:chromosome segregation ATPase